MKGIYLLLGSNLGNRKDILIKAAALIQKRIGSILKASAVYSTKAWGIEDQPDFLNQVIEIETSYTPGEVLIKINEIESYLGRIREIKWHSRIIDIDILYFNNLTIKTEKLVIPHPENENRKFVLVPMVEIAPELIHPILKKNQKELLDNCPDELEVKQFDL